MRNAIRIPVTLATSAALAAGALYFVEGSFRAAVLAQETAPTAPAYAPGTRVFGVDVGGRTQAEAGHAVRVALAALAQRPVTLTHNGRAFDRTWSGLGARADVDTMLAEAWGVPKPPLRIWMNLGATKASVKRAARALDVPPTGARFVGVPGQSQAVPGRPGRRVNVPASAEQVRMALEQDYRTASVPLVVEEAPPLSSPEDLAALTTLVAKYTTRYNPGEVNRTHNLTLVAQRLNGGFVPPGQTFSFNETVGERRASQGFREAYVYREGVQVMETAGGLCQVSSTLYNVALLAGLPIAQRSNHSLTVTYVPPGRDATVYWGAHDLQFVNDLATPLYIRAVPGGGRLTVEAWGAEALGRDVAVWSTSARRGTTLFANTYRRIREGAETRTERLSSDSYNTVHRTAG